MKAGHDLVRRPIRLASWTRAQRTLPPLIHPVLPSRTQQRRYDSSSSSLGNTVLRPRPRRLAIVGSGPAGFYSARRLLQRLGDGAAAVDMYERLPVPFGLVRFGVAPDHPEVKNCVDTFNEVAASPGFRFFGNVEVGRDVPLAALLDSYDAVLLAYGAAADRTLSVPGEKELEDNSRQGGGDGGQGGAGGGGLYSARAFVGWYNGLPEYADLDPRLDDGDTAVVVGQGNVALDVARVLLSDVDRLRNTDMAEHALAALSKSTIKRVHVVGRRGPMQAAFTIKELRELLQLEGVNFHEIEKGLLPENPKKLPRAKRRIAELLTKYSDAAAGYTIPSGAKSWSLGFMRSPSAFIASTGAPRRLEAVEFTKTKFADGEGEDANNDPGARVEATSATERVDACVAFRSIGYKSVALPGMEQLGVNFDGRRGVVPNIEGRVITSTGAHIGGLYCTGWVKNGPTGVIATTMEDAFAAAEAIVQDWTSAAGADDRQSKHGWEALKDSLTSSSSSLSLSSPPPVVSWDDWLKIDAAEREAGRKRGKERGKFPTVHEMLQCL